MPVDKTPNPVNDYLLVTRDQTPTMVGKIHLPDQAKEKLQTGLVVACGPGKLSPQTGARMVMPCAVGDRVLFGRNSGQELSAGGGSWLVMKGDEVIALLPKEKA